MATNENIASEDQHTLSISVWRGTGETGRMENYDVPSRESQTILDVVTYIQQEIDPTLTYRFSCRVGMCGSCAMMVNGEPRWTCRTHVMKVAKQGQIEIAPLSNLPVIKDLATDMTEFFDKWVKAEGVFQGRATRDDAMAAIKPESAKRQAANAGIECINCAVCYAACDAVSQNPDYLGPAALNRAWTLVNDERDSARTERLRAVSEKGGCHTCHSHQSCMTYCPNELNPTASIAGLKRASLSAYLKGDL